MLSGNSFSLVVSGRRWKCGRTVNDIPLVYLIAACYAFQRAILSFVTTSTILEVIKGMDLRASKSPPTMHLVGQPVPNPLKDDLNPKLIFSPQYV